MIKVALISPPYRVVQHLDEPVYPMGLGYIKAMCEIKGIHCDLYDFSATNKEDYELVKQYDLQHYDIIGISSYTVIFMETMHLVDAIKTQNNVIVIGGHHVSLAKEKVLQDFPNIDYGLIGFGEYSFFEFVHNFNTSLMLQTPGLCYRKNNQIIVNPVNYKDFVLDELPFPDREEIVFDFDNKLSGEKTEKVLSISSSRGCPYHCAYCVNCKNSYWLSRSISSVMDEIILAFSRKEYKVVSFVDCNFFVKPDRAYEIIMKVLALNNTVEVTFQTRCDQIVDNEMLISKILSTKRCNLALGVESNSIDVLKRYKKEILPETNQAAIDILKKYGTLSKIYIIMFEALETLEDVRKNLEFIKRNNLCRLYMSTNIYNTLMPFYGSTYYEEYSEYYENVIHGKAKAYFVDNRVQKLYQASSTFRNDYEDKIKKNIMFIDKNSDEGIKEINYLEKVQYMAFEYLLIMCETYGFCDYDTLKQSTIIKNLDIILDKISK